MRTAAIMPRPTITPYSVMIAITPVSPSSSPKALMMKSLSLYGTSCG